MLLYLRLSLLITLINCTPPRLNGFQRKIVDFYGTDINLARAESIIREEAARIGLTTAYFDTCSANMRTLMLSDQEMEGLDEESAMNHEEKVLESLPVLLNSKNDVLPLFAAVVPKAYAALMKELKLIDRMLARVDPNARAFAYKVGDILLESYVSFWNAKDSSVKFADLILAMNKINTMYQALPQASKKSLERSFCFNTTLRILNDQNTPLFVSLLVVASFAQDGSGSDDLLCPSGYLGIDVQFDTGKERWCFVVNEAIFPSKSVTFQEAKDLCEDRNDETLPILTSQAMVDALDKFRVGYFLGYCWIGIVCENEELKWTDGQPVTFDEFDKPPDSPCSESIHYAQTNWKKWTPKQNTDGLPDYVCTRRALPYIPSLPTMPPSRYCPDGMFLISDWCYMFGELPADTHGTYDVNMSTKRYCESEYNVSLPSISNDQDESSILYIRRYFLGVDYDLLWIGLECGSDKLCQTTGKWIWSNGEQWTGYTYYSNIPQSCDPNADVSTLLDRGGYWINGTDRIVKYFLCSTKPDLPEQYDSTTVESEVSSDEPDTTMANPTTTTEGDVDTPIWVWVMIGIGIVGGVALILAVLFFLLMRRGKIRKLEEMVEKERHEAMKSKASVVNSTANIYYVAQERSDEWEIDRKFVGIDYTSKLGEGAFGSVFIGRVLSKNIPLTEGKSIVELTALRNDNDAVAVKMLHETADGMAELDFRSEIDLMKKIGYHERLVNILACVTLSTPILLISEYCANGDLLAFMRERRKYMLSNADHLDENYVITVRKQMMFAIQIAYGLEYLSSRGFIHRDIAARNIMVDQQESCKIGDFGLCRAIGREEENYHSQGGKLPLKWMSPEAIDKYNFASASDVWSYGVLLFEIVTLGGVPYADWPAAELLSRLKQGQRMDRPENCSDSLFELMTQCWAEQPSERPHFAQIRQGLGVLLENVSQDDYYLKLNANANYYVMESNTS